MVWLRQIRRKQPNHRLPQIVIISIGFLLILVGKADVTAVRYMQGGIIEVFAPLYSVITVPIESIETLFGGVQTVASLRTESKRLSIVLAADFTENFFIDVSGVSKICRIFLIIIVTELQSESRISICAIIRWKYSNTTASTPRYSTKTTAWT